MKTFNFSKALERLKKGDGISRKGFNNESISIRIQTPDKKSKMTEPYLYMEKSVNGKVKRFPLDLSCESVLSEDWFVVAE